MSASSIRHGIVILLGLALLSGCGSEGPTVTGLVKLDGQPVDGAMVRFYRTTDAAEPAYHAVSGKDGTFQMPGGDAGHGGVPSGNFTVTVSKFKTGMMAMKSAKEAAPEASILPAKYADVNRSPFKHVLKAGSNHLELAMEGGKK